MARTIGITTAEDIATGLVEGHELVGQLRIYEQGPEDEPLLSLPPDGIAQRFADEIRAVAAGQTVDAIGVGLPGIINCGFIEESPNLRQLKGAHMQDLLAAALRRLRHHGAGVRLQRRRCVWRPAWPPRTEIWTASFASGRLAMASALEFIRGAKAYGKADT